GVGRLVLGNGIVVFNDALPESAIMRALRSNRCRQKKQKQSKEKTRLLQLSSRIQCRRCGRIRLRTLLHELSLPTSRPRIIFKAEPHSVGNGRMIVEEDDMDRIGFWIGQVHLAQNLKSLSSDLSGIRRKPVRDFESVLIGLVLQVSAECAADRVRDKQKKR